MNNNDINLVTFDTVPVKVTRAEYKNSVYFIANGEDITDYVISVHGEVDNVDILSLQNVVSNYLYDNPDKKVVDYPVFNFYLLDDKFTSEMYVHSFCREILGFRTRQCENVVNDLNSASGEAFCGTFIKEVCTTLCAFITHNNYQRSENLGFRIEELSEEQKIENLSKDALSKLISRDYPQDL
ncbi:ClpS domain-containing protein [Xanthomonas phage XaC1]|nr:ClpS domain-containing protein [Xanthomonas phage XaC1]